MSFPPSASPADFYPEKLFVSTEKFISLLLPFFPPSCWLSLEGGLLYSFVGPAAAVVLVRTPSYSCGTSQLFFIFFIIIQVHFIILSSSHLFVSFLSLKQVNMVIGILVFNKLVSKDGITDVKLKERAG